jgi:Domain of unknown function (DUF4383)
VVKTLGILTGISFMLGGALAFVPGVTNGALYFGFFMVNTAHNIMHIASGAIFLIASMLGPKFARLWFQIFGAFYAALAGIRFVVGDGLIFGIIMNRSFRQLGTRRVGSDSAADRLRDDETNCQCLTVRFWYKSRFESSLRAPSGNVGLSGRLLQFVEKCLPQSQLASCTLQTFGRCLRRSVCALEKVSSEALQQNRNQGSTLF